MKGREVVHASPKITFGLKDVGLFGVILGGSVATWNCLGASLEPLESMFEVILNHLGRHCPVCGGAIRMISSSQRRRHGVDSLSSTASAQERHAFRDFLPGNVRALCPSSALGLPSFYANVFGWGNAVVSVRQGGGRRVRGAPASRSVLLLPF